MGESEQGLDETGTALVDAALAVYLERGWQGASLAEIAGRAGLTTGAIYSRFSGKNELFAAVLERELERMNTEVARRLGEVASEVERLAVLRQWFRERRGRAGVRIFYDLWHQAAEYPRLRKALSAIYERMTEGVASGLERYLGPRLHAVGLEARTLAVVSTALMEGLLLRQFLTQSEEPVDLVFDALERWLAPLLRG
jgi:AcrR family transcriptional regulator